MKSYLDEIVQRPHSAIVHFPIALFPVSFIFLLLYFTRGHSLFFLEASYWCFMLGALAVIPVGLTGVLDMVRLKSSYDSGGKHYLSLHMINGFIVLLLSVIGGLYFLIKRPVADLSLVPYFSLLVIIQSILVLMQGFWGGLMVYRHHLGIEGDTR